MASFILKTIEQQFAQNPESTAVEDGERVITYHQLDQDSARLAWLLRREGVGRESIVGIFIERSYEMVLGVLAVMRAGGCYLPLDSGYPDDRLQFMLKDAKTTKVLSMSGMEVSRLGLDGQVLLLDQTLSNPVAVAPLTDHISPDDLAYIIYTSGSTGQPKGVAMIHQPVEHLMRWQIADCQLPRGAATLQFSPLSFDVSFQEIFATLCSGGKLVIIQEEQRLNGGELLRFIENKGINRLFLPFVALQVLAESAAQFNRSPACLKEVITAGEALQVNRHIRQLFSRIPGARLQNQYGPSESHVVTSFDLVGDPATWPTIPPIGKPLPHVECLILDERLKSVNSGDTGELYLGGESLAQGYLHRPELTAARFFSINGKRVYKTGDMVRLAPGSKDIEYLGRIDEQVKIRGYRIELGEIEVALSNHPKVGQALVDVRRNEHGDKKLVAYLVAEPVSISELRSFLEKALPDYMVPANFVFLEKFKRTPSGKIDRRSLPDPSRERPALAEEYRSPVSVFQEKLVDIWQSLLEIAPVGIEDNFFDLGGNSLLALRFIDWLKCECGVDLSPVELFQNPTIAKLSGRESRRESRDTELESILVKHQEDGVRHDIAIIGMALRFPGADSIETFWHNLLTGTESMRRFSPEELRTESTSIWGNDPKFVPVKGVIERPGHFDAAFFGISPREAEVLDPQQRVFLQLAWSAMEDAGYPPIDYSGEVGVYAGTGNNSYYRNNLLTQPDVIDRAGHYTVMTGNEKDYIATRTAHKLHLTGPAVSVHSACSTSLLAVHLAVKALRSGDCDMAIAGGASVSAPQCEGYLYQEGGMQSADGHCRPFDALATGTIFGDGAGAILLKPLAHAIADGDHIYGVIKGSAANNDGGDKASFSAPNPVGQSRVILKAQVDAAIEAKEVGFVEAHGTATPLGDPIEVQALGDAFAANGGSSTCLLGSVKSNFGHLTAAAGIAGLIKATLIVNKGVVPPTLHFNTPNPAITWQKLPFRVNVEVENWLGSAQRVAAVSSFGVGGTNVHTIVAQPPAKPPSGLARPWQLVQLSHHSEDGLAQQETALRENLTEQPSLADVAYTLHTGRRVYREMSFVIADTPIKAGDLFRDKKAPAYLRLSRQPAGYQPAFVFPGQGAQMVGMGQTFYEREAVFQQSVDQIAALLLPLLKEDIRHLLFPTLFTQPENPGKLSQTLYTQLGLFSTEYALSQLWQSWGITPVAMLGHSIGEWVAACVAETVSLPDAVSAVFQRGRLMQAQPPGQMLSVRAEEKKVREILPQSLDFAAINSPLGCVVAGEAKEIALFSQKCSDSKIINKVLLTSHAFHSRMMESAVAEFHRALAEISFKPPVIPFISSVTGTWISKEQACSADYWSAHIRKPVRFADGVQTLLQKTPLLIFELGPRSTLTSLINQNKKRTEISRCLPVLSNEAQTDLDWGTTLTALAHCLALGIPVNWNNYYAFENRHRVRVPTYCFEGIEYWVKPPRAGAEKNNLRGIQLSHDVPSAPCEGDHLSTIMLPTMEKDMETRNKIVNEVIALVEDVSGFDLDAAAVEESFLELGLDSLVLTQLATSLKGRFAVDISFRQLMEEFTSTSLVADFLISRIAPEEMAVTASDAQRPATASVGADAATSVASISLINEIGHGTLLDNVPPGSVEQLIRNQLSVMSQQLDLLRRGTAAGTKEPAVLKCEKNTPRTETGQKKTFGAQAKIETTRSEALTPELEEAVKEFVSQYAQKFPKSKQFTQDNREVLADPRAVSGFKPLIKEMVFPIVVKESNGSKLLDIDGHQYVDLVNGFGTNFLGHGPEFIKSAIHQQLDIGLEIGPQNLLAAEVAKLICTLSGMDRAALCNTGSEAVIGAIRLARTVTGRYKIVMFEGAYHGINDEEIVRCTKSGKPFPAAAGIPPESVANVVVLEYGSDEALAWIRTNAASLAAVLIEPVQSRRPDFQPGTFLQAVRECTAASGTALIFDEVITGFRICPGGAQEYFGVRADIATYGKIIGGGMPIGAIAGKREYMDALDGGFWRYGDDSVPEIGVTYFAGTFVRHPLTMAAAKAALTHIQESGPQLQQEVNSKAQGLIDQVNEYYRSLGFPCQLKNFGSLFKIWFEETEPLFFLFFYKLRELGVHVWEGRPCFITVAHSREDLQFLNDSFREAAQFMIESGFLKKFLKKMREEPDESGLELTPPVDNARLGRDPQGIPGWYIEDQSQPGNFIKVGDL